MRIVFKTIDSHPNYEINFKERGGYSEKPRNQKCNERK